MSRQEGAWSVWRADNDLVGVVVRATLEASDAERLALALSDALEQAQAPPRLFIDALHLDQAGCGVVAAEILWKASRAFMVQHRFARIGMVHAIGASGALIAGWTRLLGGTWPSLVSSHHDEVLAFLDLAPMAPALDSVRGNSSAALALEIAGIFKAQPRIRVAALARAVGLGVPDLRAHFAARGTTYREESLRRRLDVAREALANGDAKLEAVALESGFNSGSHLAAALRRHSPQPSHPTAPARHPSTRRGGSSLGRHRTCIVDLAQFLRAPLGHCHARASWLIWQVDTSLAMCSVFGAMAERDLGDLFACIDAVMDTAKAPLDVLSDATLAQIKDVGAAGMALLYRYTSEHKERLTRCIRRHAITATDTPGGAFLGGLGDVNEARHPWRLMRSVDEALAWFGREDGPALAAEMAELIAHARHGGALLLEIEARLKESPTHAIGEVARSLGMSVRALQRACGDQGTTFRELHRRALLERARALLSESDLKIEGIARELGLRSRSHFMALFRSATGTTPSEYRRLARSEERDV